MPAEKGNGETLIQSRWSGIARQAWLSPGSIAALVVGSVPYAAVAALSGAIGCGDQRPYVVWLRRCGSVIPRA